MGLGLISLLAIVAAPWVMPLFAPGLAQDLVNETVQLARIMFPIVVLLGLTGLVAAVLQAHGEFGATAFVPVLWNVVIIVGLMRRGAARARGRPHHGLRGRRSSSARSPSSLYLLPVAARQGPVPDLARAGATRACARCWC